MAGCVKIGPLFKFSRYGGFSQKYIEIRPEFPPAQAEQADYDSYCQANGMSSVVLELSFMNRTNPPASSKFFCGEIGGELMIRMISFR